MFKLSKLQTNDTVNSVDRNVMKYVFYKDCKVCDEDNENNKDNKDNEENSEDINCEESS